MACTSTNLTCAELMPMSSTASASIWVAGSVVNAAAAALLLKATCKPHMGAYMRNAIQFCVVAGPMHSQARTLRRVHMAQ